MVDFSDLLPTFLATLREGFEAALVVGIVMACLEKAEKPVLRRWVALGIGGGILASCGVGLILRQSLQSLTQANHLYASVLSEALDGLFALFAIAMLAWMLIWMTRQGNSLKTDVSDMITSALTHDQGAGKGIFLLVFIAILREGFEIVLFVLTQFEAGLRLPTIGAILGLACAALLSFLLFRVGLRLDIKRFFQVMGIFLLLIIGGLIISALKHIDSGAFLLNQIEPTWSHLCLSNSDSCLLGLQIWNGTNIMPESQFPGILLKTLFGYRENLFLAQAIAYVLFMGTVGGLYWQFLQVSTRSTKLLSSANKEPGQLTK
ncbi:MAG: FTR1 family protein [Cyanobacteria bacterium P01_H01_bin.15]